MALQVAQEARPASRKKIRIRFQELDLKGNGRPDEEDLGEGRFSADSIGDLPLPGDFIGIEVKRVISKVGETLATENQGQIFRVLTRLFDFQLFSLDSEIILCNIVVEAVDERLVGKLMKD